MKIELKKRTKDLIEMMNLTKQQRLLIGLASIAFALALTIDQASAFEPVVETGVSELSANGRHVSVHVPAITDLKYDSRGPREGFRLRLNILAGLVKVYIDRARDPLQPGRMYGPIQVKVLGMTAYDNGAGPATGFQPPPQQV